MTDSSASQPEQLPRNPYKTLNHILKEIEISPVSQPLNQHFIRVKYAKTVENQFNKFWFHMYKILADIETRRFEVNSAKNTMERDLLTEYAKKAVALKAAKGRALESIAEIEDFSPNVATEAKLQCLANIKYLDAFDINSQPINEDKDNRLNRHNNKYKRKVLIALGLECEEEGITKNDRQRKLDRRLTSVGNMRKNILLKNLDSNLVQPESKINDFDDISTPETKRIQNVYDNAKKAHAERKMSCVDGPQITKFSDKYDYSDFKAHPIFRAEILTPLEKYDISPEITLLSKAGKSKSQMVLEEINKESNKRYIKITKNKQDFKRHPQEKNYNNLLHNNLSPNTPTSHPLLDKITEHIYGKKKKRTISTSGGVRVKLNLDGLDEKSQLLIKSHQKPAFRKLAKSARNSPDVSMSKQNRSGIKSNFFITERNSLATRSAIRSMPSSRKNSREKAENSKIFNILEQCEVEQHETEKSIAKIAELHKNVKIQLDNITQGLKKQKMNKEDMGGYVKQLKDKKCLFLYGKEGKGRYLRADTKDMIKVSDQMSKINPKYRFMQQRMTNLYKNT